MKKIMAGVCIALLIVGLLPINAVYANSTTSLNPSESTSLVTTTSTTSPTTIASDETSNTGSVITTTIPISSTSPTTLPSTTPNDAGTDTTTTTTQEDKPSSEHTTTKPTPTPAPAPYSGPVVNVDVLNDLTKIYAPGEAFEFRLNVKNLLDKDIKAMLIELKLDDKSAFMLDPQFTLPPTITPAPTGVDGKPLKFEPETLAKKVDFRSAEEKIIVFKLITKEDLTNLSSEIPLTLRFAPQPSGSDPAGCPLITGYETKSTIRLKAEMPQPSITPDIPVDYYGGGSSYISSGDAGTGASSMKNKPKLIVSKYNISPKMAKAGQEFTLNLTFFNTNADKSCRNIKIILSTDLPSSGGTDSAAAAQVMNVFTPVNSSNTFYIAKIEPGATDEKSITFAVGPTVASKNYTMFVKFEYEDADGNQLEANESIGIPVVQEAKIEADEVKLPQEASVGQAMNLDYNVYNVGKDSLSNLMIEYVGPMQADPARSFVGNFASGASSMFSTSLTPMQEGPVEGAIKISYEDSTGETHTIEKAFTVKVMGMPEFDPNSMPGYDPSMEGGEVPSEAKPFYMNPLVWGGAAALLFLLILITVLKKRKEKKLQKDLNLDE